MNDTQELVDRLYRLLDKLSETAVCRVCCDSEAAELEDRIRKVLELWS